MKIIRLIISLALTVGLFYGLDNKFGSLPPVGKFFNPFAGFWQNAEPRQPDQQLSWQFPELEEEVEIIIDQRQVPHIFAKNDHDLYFMQGYITAKYRLWQMEFQTHAAAGRLTEILGKGPDEVLLRLDQHRRRIGMVYAAERALEEMSKDPEIKAVMEAYTDGVNAYIRQLSAKDYPLEYKLLDYEPEPWTPLKSALLLKYMAYDLSGANDDAEMTQILQQMKNGSEVIAELFPNYPTPHDPIIPAGTVWDFKNVKTIKPPKNIVAPPEQQPNPDGKADNQDKQDLGSNNWAISAEKSASGYPILANDPHLTLNLPSIWFEIQLVSDKVNVYGVSLPGSPCVTIGFNRHISWGVTNVDPDVLDWYKIKFKDESLAEYWYEGEWKPTTSRKETLYVRGGEVLVDTVIYTHHGPVVAKPGTKANTMGASTALPGHALRWLAHDPSNELRTFYELNRAQNYKDYREALVHYVCPAQNFIFSDINKDIAITPNGKFPLKWKGQGKFVLDGTDAKHEWQGWIPNEHNPHLRNPARGFVSSANQFPTDTLYPYYLNWEYATYERGWRINEVLESVQKGTPQTMIALQNDNLGLLARDVLPELLKYLDANKLKGEGQKAYQALQGWDFMYETKHIAPTIFEAWWDLLYEATWSDDFGNKERGLRYPAIDKTAELILLNDSIPVAWFDDINTPEKETLQDLAQQTFDKAIKTLIEKHGAYGEAWTWGKTKTTSILHLTQIPAFSVLSLPTAGNKRIVNATGKRSGPSWRMVVAMGKTNKGFGIYPGGQSGNPGSFYYDNMIEPWLKGELAELTFMRKVNENVPNALSRITCKKK
ncbi:penicillin acylase family protein [Eisenibacter elegans]|jgi:penicillin amidase|uniref:penicillin acylase family protein n=1 Tax=Eisenibacter elegans TaxID=997 RepID=UPI0005514CEA|nr:penicillin acylase family protein [Eisenibacter elegans]